MIKAYLRLRQPLFDRKVMSRLENRYTTSELANLLTDGRQTLVTITSIIQSVQHGLPGCSNSIPCIPSGDIGKIRRCFTTGLGRHSRL